VTAVTIGIYKEYVCLPRVRWDAVNHNIVDAFLDVDVDQLFVVGIGKGIGQNQSYFGTSPQISACVKNRNVEFACGCHG
jgi:hypothetical protein